MTNAEGPHILEPVQAADGEAAGKPWPYRLMLFLRVMAGVSLCKGLYHWAVICGIGAPLPSGFDSYSTPYQVATVFFAVIDLVAGVGLWLPPARVGVGGGGTLPPVPPPHVLCSPVRPGTGPTAHDVGDGYRACR